ncbi:MAG: hypothetical protein RL208_625 [Pseudomonadota bacterium]
MSDNKPSFFSKQSCNTDCTQSLMDKAKCTASIVVLSSIVSFATVKIMSQKIVEDAITKNPKHIITAIENMYKKEREKSMEESTKKVPDVQKDILANSSIPYVGNQNASKQIIVFYDYACGYCKKQVAEIAKLTAKDKDVKVVLVDFPIMSAGSLTAAQVGIYVFNNHKSSFERYHNEIAKLSSLTPDSIKGVLKKLNLNTSIVTSVQNDEKIKAMIESNYTHARTLALQGTPAVIANNKLVPSFVDANDMESMLK